MNNGDMNNKDTDGSDNNLNDSMFNFDFLSEDESPIDINKNLTNDSSLPDCSGAQEVTTERESESRTEQVEFNVIMERRATAYFSVETMQEFNIVPAHFDSISATLTVFCDNHPNEELCRKLKSLLIGQESVRIVLQFDSPGHISSLLERINNNSKFFKSMHTEAPVDSIFPATEDCSNDDNSFESNIEVSVADKFESRDERNAESERIKEIQQDSSEGIVGNETSDSGPKLLEPTAKESSSRRVLFVTPEGSLSPHLLFAIHAEKISPVISASCNDALNSVSCQNVDEALIHESLRDSSKELALSLQKNGKRVPVRSYSSESGLLTGEVHDQQLLTLFEKNLSLANYLLSKSNNSFNSNCRSFIELCCQFSKLYAFPQDLHLTLLSAAYWHDSSRFDLTSPTDHTQRDIISLSISKLESLDFPEQVIDLLKIMANPKLERASFNSDTLFNSNTLLAGNILAVCDYYYHRWLANSEPGSESFAKVCSALEEFSHSLTVPEVVNSLIELIKCDYSAGKAPTEAFTVHILDLILERENDARANIESALVAAGFNFSVSGSTAECVQSWRGMCKPQALLILHSGSAQQVTDTLFSLALDGVKFNSIPTIALAADNALELVTRSITHGLEDVFSLSVNPEILIAKLTRAKERQQALENARLTAFQDMGTHGSLEDMNIIKLLEASRDSSRALRLSATAEGKQLIAFVESNSVLYATCDELIGIDAISAGIDWKKGIWSLDPIDASELPPANLGLSLDSVMLEACMQRDITTRSTSSK